MCVTRVKFHWMCVITYVYVSWCSCCGFQILFSDSLQRRHNLTWLSWFQSLLVIQDCLEASGWFISQSASCRWIVSPGGYLVSDHSYIITASESCLLVHKKRITLIKFTLNSNNILYLYITPNIMENSDDLAHVKLPFQLLVKPCMALFYLHLGVTDVLSRDPQLLISRDMW